MKLSSKRLADEQRAARATLTVPHLGQVSGGGKRIYVGNLPFVPPSKDS